jgi:hypothetical protein
MRLKYIENETCFILNYIFFVFDAKNEVDLQACVQSVPGGGLGSKFWVHSPRFDRRWLIHNNILGTLHSTTGSWRWIILNKF